MLYFTFSASPKTPNGYKVARLFNSRSFSHRTVEAFHLTDDGLESSGGSGGSSGTSSKMDTSTQAFFRMECSFKAHEEDEASFMAKRPEVPRPEELEPIHKVVKGLDQ